MIKDIGKWLKQSPKKSEIVEIQTGKVKDGKSETVKIIPQKIIESLLDELTEQNWSTRNFQFSRCTEQLEKPSIGMSEVEERMNPDIVKGFKSTRVRTMCDASLELVVTYKVVVPVSPYKRQLGDAALEEIEITRTLVGAVSFDVSFFGNDHIANTAKSLAIANASTELGNRFGRNLNPKEAAMMIVGMKQPIIPPVVDKDQRDKIGETLNKLKGELTKKMNG